MADTPTTEPETTEPETTEPETTEPETTEPETTETRAADSDEAGAEAAGDDAGRDSDSGEERERRPSRPAGRVKVFDEERSFGFVQPLEGGRDIFVHVSDVERGEVPRPGDVVEFDLVDGDDGPQGVSVRIVARAPEDNPAGRMVIGGAPPTWDQLERIQRELRQDRRQRRRRR